MDHLPTIQRHTLRWTLNEGVLAMDARKKKVLFHTIMIILMLGVIEGTAFLGCLILQSKSVIYRPSHKAYSKYIASRDARLGWPSPERFGHDGLFDATGSRLIPAFPDPTEYRAWISLYGDSFTWGSEVDNDHAWSNILSEMLRARVSNYGVPGYGTDQAFLRFLHNTGDEAQIVFLNHMSENIRRNINQYRELIEGDGGIGGSIGFKPRFIMDGHGQFTLIPLPSFSEIEYPNVVNDPERYLPYEYFIPNGPSGIQKLSFPYTWTVLKCLRNFHIRAKLFGAPLYTEFYAPDHPSQALSITVGILKRFHEETRTRGKIPIITIIPSGQSLLFFREKGYWPYQPLLDELRHQEIEALNFGEGIIRRLGTNDMHALFNNNSAHYKEKGNRILADIAFEHLREKRLLLP
jgi:hypothetical protein